MSAASCLRTRPRPREPALRLVCACAALSACGGQEAGGDGQRSATLRVINFSNFTAQVTVGADTQTVAAESEGRFTSRWTGGDTTTLPLRAVALERPDLSKSWSVTATSGAEARAYVEFDSATRDRVGAVPFSHPYEMYSFNDGIPKPYFASREFGRLVGDVAALGKRIDISEFSYPNDPAGTTGRPGPRCPFSPEGQAAWVQDFLAAALARAEIERVFFR